MAIFHTLHIVSDKRHAVFYGDILVGSIWLEPSPRFAPKELTQHNAPILLSVEAMRQLVAIMKSFEPPEPPECEFIGCRRRKAHFGACTTIGQLAERWDAEDAKAKEAA